MFSAIKKNEYQKKSWLKLIIKGSVYIENNLIDSDGGMYWTVDSWIN